MKHLRRPTPKLLTQVFKPGDRLAVPDLLAPDFTDVVVVRKVTEMTVWVVSDRCSSTEAHRLTFAQVRKSRRLLRRLPQQESSEL